MALSRICIKNLPPYLNEDRLRDHFAAKGEVTDAKIVRTRDGESRQFGFVGYKSENEAYEAVQYFQRSFIDTFRLAVELARPIGDDALPRPWSKHSAGSSAYAKVNPPAEGDSKDAVAKPKTAREAKKARKLAGKVGEELEGDSEFQEFLQVMQPRQESKLWANDTSIGALQKGAKKDMDKQTLLKADGKGSEEKELVKAALDEDSEGESDLYEDLAEKDDDISSEQSDEVETPKLAKDEKVSDLDYLKSKVKATWSDDEGDTSNGEDESEEEVEDPEQESVSEEVEAESEDDKEEGNGDVEDKELEERRQSAGEAGPREVDAEQEESVAETGRLFVRNLPYTATEDELREVFEKFGEVSEVHIVLDRETKRSKGFAYVLFMLPEDAVRAMETLDSSFFQGRLLHILPARRAPQVQESLVEQAGKGGKGMGASATKVKEEREEERKAAEMGGDYRAWNALFMRPDTVAEYVAQKYQVSKSELLDPEAGDLAVRMALGETHIIAETKKALESQGVSVAALERAAESAGNKGSKAVKRSNHVLLVKNLPFATTENDLVGLFEKFGGLGRVVLPPTKTLALVEFLEAAEARRAFKGMAYKRFKHVPLYLEWAPEGVLIEDQSAAKNAAAQRSSSAAPSAREAARVVVETAVPQEDEDTESSEGIQTVFVKNLAFTTTNEGLKRHFGKVKGGEVRAAKIQTKPGKNGKQLSCGFGFVEFGTADGAKAAIKQLQGSMLDGHALVLQLSRQGAGTKQGAAAGGSRKKGEANNKLSSTKLIVRNVPFEANKRELQALFSPFGQMKSLRLPKKFDGSHRGFAFIEFITRQEAQSAYDALRDTHLYGRHLVLESAKEGEGLEELRQRTAARFHADDETPARKRVKTGED